ncbi:MAG: hypothetical protein D6828_05400 [Nitrospirae bacterium]|nr:MAG: hypothetical protein D6828_05400 [Nitrospirota bacterium]
MRKRTYTICGMCTVRCPICVEVEGGEIKHIWGNPHVLGGLHLCPRGAAGKAFEYDRERPKHPMIRDGERGSGRWKKVSWEEALDYVADKLLNIIEQHGPESIVLSDRGGPISEFEKTFLMAIGSPNYFTHHASCSNSAHNAHMSIAGLARNAVGYDYKNCKYLVLYGRNILESLGTSEAKDVIDMLQSGGKLIYIDVRWNYTASKADRFFMIRPGTDYALNLAIINVILSEELYDNAFVDRWVTGIERLRGFTAPYTPKWAEEETGIPAKEIIKIAHEAKEASPSVIFHPGWMTAWDSNDFYLRRSIYTINALMGSYEAKGGMFFVKSSDDVGIKLKTLTSQVKKVEKERFDRAETEFPHLNSQWGLAQMLPDAITNEDPYPIKGYIVMRHDPLASLPDPDAFKEALKKLELIVSIDVNYSETGWISDVILPESTYLERTDHVYVRKGLRPALALRRKVIEPTFDTRPRSYIFKALAERLGVGHYFNYENIEELIEWQLEGTGFKMSDFDEKGIIPLTDTPIWFDRKNGLKFKTPSKKIELFSSKLEQNNIPSFIDYESPKAPPKGHFKLITGKVAVHTQGRTTANNPLLNEIIQENYLWINSAKAEELGIEDGDIVEVSNEGVVEKIKAKVTDLIHPEAVFMLHGFGDTVPLRSRSYRRGASDVRLQKGLLKVTIGGNCPLTECIVSVRRTGKREDCR